MIRPPREWWLSTQDPPRTWVDDPPTFPRLTVFECVEAVMRMQEEEKAIKAYVHFTNDDLPWIDRTTVYVSKNGRPRDVVLLLLEAHDRMRMDGTDEESPTWPHPSAIPVLAATHLIAISPMTILPHSRVLLPKTPGASPPQTMLNNVYTEAKAADEVGAEYRYWVKCVQQRSRAGSPWRLEWQVSVEQRKTHSHVVNPVDERDMQGKSLEWYYDTIWQMQDIQTLHGTVERLKAFIELGGVAENI